VSTAHTNAAGATSYLHGADAAAVAGVAVLGVALLQEGGLDGVQLTDQLVHLRSTDIKQGNVTCGMKAAQCTRIRAANGGKIRTGNDANFVKTLSTTKILRGIFALQTQQ
jgi:hypothetical protein